MSSYSNPWLGLMTYTEGQPLYGRTEEIKTLSSYILQSDQTIVYGRSGIGKSSLLNAGVFPLARRQGYFPLNIRLQHHSSVSYLEQISNALSAQQLDIVQLVPRVEGHEETLWEYFHRHRFLLPNGQEIKPLIVLDQFEEIFTLARDKARVIDFFCQLGDLLNHVTPDYISDAQLGVSPASPSKATTAPQSQDTTSSPEDLLQLDLDASFIESMSTDTADYLTTSNFHIVIIIREDYLAFLEHATSRIPSLRYNRYFLQPINEEQALEIITQPQPGLVSRDVARLIIENVTNRTDFDFDGRPEIPVDSAVLSLFLERLYIKMQEKGETTLTAELISLYGGDIIKDFYLSSIDGLPLEMVEYMEDSLITNDGHRENVSVSSATTEGPLTEDFISLLCGEDANDRTRRLLRRFNYAGTDRIEFLHDILCPVVIERRQQRMEARRLAEVKAAAAKERQRMRRTARILIGSLLGLLGVILGIYFTYFHVYSSEYASFTRINGWPVGIETGRAPSQQPLYYRLTRTGLFGPYTDVEVCSSNPRLPQTPRFPLQELYSDNANDPAAQHFERLLSRATHIHFEANNEGQINRETVMCKDSTLLVISYFHVGSSPQAWLRFTTSSGQSMPFRQNGADRIKLRWDEQGRISNLMFFDSDGICQPVAEGVQAYAIRYFADGSISRYKLNEYGNMMSVAANVITTRITGDSTYLTYSHATSVADTLPTPVLTPEGYARRVFVPNVHIYYGTDFTSPIARQQIVFDRCGNVTEEAIIGGKLAASVPPRVRYTYDPRTGYPTSVERLTADEQPFRGAGASRECWDYDEDGEVILHERYLVDKLVYSRTVKHEGNITTTTVRDEAAPYKYIARVDSVRGDTTSTSWFGSRSMPLNYDDPADNTESYHRKLSIRQQKDTTTVETHYFIVNNDGRQQRRPAHIDSVGIARAWYRDIQTFDADGNLLTSQRLGADDVVIKSMVYYYQNGQHVARAAMGIDGTPVRCPNWEEDGFGYYKIFYSVDFRGRFVSVSPVDEWNQPSLFYDPTIEGYQRVEFTDMFSWETRAQDSPDVFLINDHYRQFVFKPDTTGTHTALPYLHILNRRSPLYDSGLRDGDRIIRAGSWQFGQSAEALASAWQQLEEEGGAIAVRRPAAAGFQLYEATVPAASEQGIQAEYHILKLTQAELNRWSVQ